MKWFLELIEKHKNISILLIIVIPMVLLVFSHNKIVELLTLLYFVVLCLIGLFL